MPGLDDALCEELYASELGDMEELWEAVPEGSTISIEAADPLGALRWNLAALRRALGRPDAMKGDAISLDLEDAEIDSQHLDDDDLAWFDAHDDAIGPLLGDLSFADSPRFEIWLTSERARLARRGGSLLRASALRALAEGDHKVAVRRAGSLFGLDPLDEGHHALLIRAHATAGDAVSAQAQFEHCRSVLRRELDADPGAAVVAAASFAAAKPVDGTLDRDLVGAHMTIAWQSFTAGSVDHGTDLGRAVVALADQGGGAALQCGTRLFLAACSPASS